MRTALAARTRLVVDAQMRIVQKDRIGGANGHTRAAEITQIVIDDDPALLDIVAQQFLGDHRVLLDKLPNWDKDVAQPIRHFRTTEIISVVEEPCRSILTTDVIRYPNYTASSETCHGPAKRSIAPAYVIDNEYSTTAQARHPQNPGFLPAAGRAG